MTHWASIAERPGVSAQQIRKSSVCSKSKFRYVDRQNSALPSFYVVRYGGHRSAPRMLAALAGFIHDRQRADGHEHNRDEGNY
jgi:hypothetical protein